jgi:hypothetical protein
MSVKRDVSVVADAFARVGIARTAVLPSTYQRREPGAVQVSPSFCEMENQMNNSNAPKIVIGVGLVAAYAIGFGVYALRARHDNMVVQGTPAPISEPMAVEPASTTMAVPEASAQTALPESSAPIAAESANAAKAPEARPSVVAQPKPRAELPVDSMPSARPPVSNEPEESSRSNSGSSAVSDLATTGAAAGESVTAAEERSSEEDSGSTETPAVDNGEQQ